MHIKIKDEKKRRKAFSDDYILGYYDAIAEIGHQLNNVKASFDLAAYQSRATQKVDKRIMKKSNNPIQPTPKAGG